MIYLSTALWLPHSGSSTAHTYTQNNTQNNTNNIENTNNNRITQNLIGKSAGLAPSLQVLL